MKRFDGASSGGMPLVQISDDNPTGLGVSHFRGLQALNWRDNSKERALLNLGGGPRPTPTTASGVPIYLHDWYGPGRHALVVSTRSPEYRRAPEKFHEEPPLTGDESRVAEVDGVELPQLLDPLDDLPPTTVVTHVLPQSDGTVLVRGTTADNSPVRSVLVNGLSAMPLEPDFRQWEAVVPHDEVATQHEVRAQATDAAGNVESNAHVVAY